MTSVNADLVVQKIYSISQQKRVFSLNLSSLIAIDPNVQSLVGLKSLIESRLSALSISVTYSETDEVLIFVSKARTVLDIIPASLIGARYERPPVVYNDPVIAPPVLNPTVSFSPNLLTIDWYAWQTESRGHVAYYYNNAARAAFQSYRLTTTVYTGNNGYVYIPPSSDMLLGSSNFTYDVRFNPGTCPVVANVTSIRALSIIDTRNVYGQGFVVELLLSNVGGQKFAFLCYRENGLRYVMNIDNLNMFTNMSLNWHRLTIVGKYYNRSIYIDGIRVLNLPVNITLPMALPIYLGTYSPFQASSPVNDGYPRALINASNTMSYMYFEWMRLVKASLYSDNFDPNTTL